MDRKQFQEYLSRSVKEGFLNDKEARVLLGRFDAGLIVSSKLPLELEVAIKEINDEYVDRATRRLLAAQRLRKSELFELSRIERGKIREGLQDSFILRSHSLVDGYATSRNLHVWQAGFRDLIAENIVQQTVTGAARELPQELLDKLNDVVQEQTAYSSAFADEIASQNLAL